VPTHLGFLCARTFIWVDLKPVGMIVVGGVAPAKWPPSTELVARVAGDVGVPADVLGSAVEEIHDLGLAEQRRVLRLLPQMGDLVSQLATARSRLAGTPQPIAGADRVGQIDHHQQEIPTPQGGDGS
jgi:hypothetical protein